MKKITHWVLGTATARVSGDTARFMNIAVKTGLRPIRLQKDGKDVLFTLYAKDYKKLHKIKQRTHTRVKLAEKSGFPFLFRRMLRRPGLLLGTALGALLGALFSFPTTGIDFVMTALFLVILINQWREQSNHLPALIGVLGSIVCLLLFGPDRFLPPAMGLILLLFTLLKKPMEQKGEKV